MNSLEELANLYVAHLRATALIHQQHHWLARGEAFYGTHLLFDRIYKSAAENADLAAEKMVGVLGAETLLTPLHFDLIHRTMKRFAGPDLIGESLAAEKSFLEASEGFSKQLDAAGKLTLGVADMLGGIASDRESAVYLLGQMSKDSGERTAKAATRRLMLRRAAKRQSD